MPANEGEIEITLAGEREVLRPTLRAAKEVNARYGGFVEAFKALQAFRLDAFVDITAAGLNKRPSEVEQAVFETGLESLITPLIAYVNLLSTGGRPLKEGAQSGKE